MTVYAFVDELVSYKTFGYLTNLLTYLTRQAGQADWRKKFGEHSLFPV